MSEAADTRTISRVAVVGGGILGAQIAIQSACFGYQASIFDSSQGAFERSVASIKAIMKTAKRGPVVTPAQWEDGTTKVKVCADMKNSLEGADLVIEAVPEDLDLKRRVFSQIDALAPASAILATNSSSIPISRIETATQRPERCLNLHFYMPVHGVNMVDIMGGTRTDSEVMDTGKRWIRSIGCVPLTVNKESFGFCFNRIWRAVKREVLHMWADGIVDYRDIDRAWMIGFGTAIGPFGLMDATGLNVTLAVETSYYKNSGDERDRPPDALKAMVEHGELGVKAGKGFYTYPNPEYASPDFLK